MESDHGKVSHSAIQETLRGFGFNRKTASFLATVLGGHHGRLNPPSERGYFPQKATSEATTGINWEKCERTS
jgi:CRISPR-associated endonuclease/helicase Cas3